ncbi:hypothetical protein [Marinomonas primoryensis]
MTYPNSLILQKAVVRFANKEAAQAMSQFSVKPAEDEATAPPPM